ncbi:MAG: hypothetical protein KA144_06550 [Xanthomonadaceae bacterium]|nr:hypothetical protein [Xanthomonadaceae bacterium]
MKHKRMGWMLTIGLSLSAAAAQAGYDGNFPVVVDDANKQAYGTLVGARRSADTVQRLGCTLKSDNAVCYATNAAGVYRSCTTTDAALMAVARSISSESYLWFVWNAAGTCTSITVGLGSQFKQ